MGKNCSSVFIKNNVSCASHIISSSHWSIPDYRSYLDCVSLIQSFYLLCELMWIDQFISAKRHIFCILSYQSPYLCSISRSVVHNGFNLSRCQFFIVWLVPFPCRNCRQEYHSKLNVLLPFNVYFRSSPNCLLIHRCINVLFCRGLWVLGALRTQWVVCGP